MIKQAFAGVLAVALLVVVGQVGLQQGAGAGRGVLQAGGAGNEAVKLAREADEAGRRLQETLKEAKRYSLGKKKAKKAEGKEGGGGGEAHEDATPLEEALSLFRKKSVQEVEESCEETKDFQSSKHFMDFKAPKHGGWRLPTDVGDSASPCDPDDYSQNPETAEACASYLADLSNWKYLRPMSSVLAEARTIKFIVQTFDPKVRAILKIPQFKFVVEPYAEYAAFTVDKLIGIDRVPPTGWVSVPIAWFRASMSVLMPAEYVRWVECFVFNHKQIKDHVKKWDGEVVSMFVSVQLWMNKVKDLRKSPLRLSTKQLESGLVPEDPLKRWALGETTDMQVFDHIIGNNDRSLSKNAFAAGDCSTPPMDCKTVFPHIVFLDQGSSFYTTKTTKTSVFGKESQRCSFRRKTFKKVLELEGNSLAKKLKKRFPKHGFLDHWAEWQTEGAQKRLNKLVAHMKNCQEEKGEDIFID